MTMTTPLSMTLRFPPAEEKKGLHARACLCERCVSAALLPLPAALRRLSALAGAKVELAADRFGLGGATEEHPNYRNGLTLDGATAELARICGFRHPNGRCYLTGPKILWLLALAGDR